MSIYALAERYDVSVNAIHSWRSKGWMPPGFLFRGRRLWWADDIAAWEQAGFPRKWESKDHEQVR
ncbi:MAG: hypothetical protein CMJ58_16965 [Planctomycetaceae bacterium]|nr:hypothetical protein [Planctomycetaceae bacterium]